MLQVTSGPALLCYDGFEPSRHAIAAAAGLLAERRAIVLNVGPLELVAEAYAAEGSGAADTSIAAAAQAAAVADAGVAEARRVGFRAEPRSSSTRRSGVRSSALPTRSARASSCSARRG